MSDFTLDAGGGKGVIRMARACRFEISRTSAGRAGPRRKSYDFDDNRDMRGLLSVSLSSSSSFLSHRHRLTDHDRALAGLRSAMAPLYKDV